MTEQALPGIGGMVGLDLTIANADEVRDFYVAVIGWTVSEYKWPDYSDYFMQVPGSDSPVAGVVHKRGDNANQPPGWIPYFRVADINASLAQVEALGGKILSPYEGNAGAGQFFLVQDPSGTVTAIMQL